MEVAVLESEGLPRGSLLSVRFGGIKRQAPVDKVHTSALKFPCSMESCCDPLKIEVLQPVAAARLVLQHREETYNVGLNPNGTCQESMSVNLQVRSTSAMLPQRPESANPIRSKTTTPSNLRPQSAPLKFQDSAISAREYLEVHGLLRYIQGLLHAVIQVRPEDPFQFMIQQLSAAAPKTNCPTPAHPCFAAASPTPEKVQKSTDNVVPQRQAVADDRHQESCRLRLKAALVMASCDGTLAAALDATGVQERRGGAQQPSALTQEVPIQPLLVAPAAQATEAEQLDVRTLGPPTDVRDEAPADANTREEEALPVDIESHAPERPLPDEEPVQEDAPLHHQHASGVAPPDHHNMASGEEQAPEDVQTLQEPSIVNPPTDGVNSVAVDATEEHEASMPPATPTMPPATPVAPVRSKRPGAQRGSMVIQAEADSILMHAASSSGCLQEVPELETSMQVGETRERLKQSLLNASASGALDEALKRIVVPGSLQSDTSPDTRSDARTEQVVESFVPPPPPATVEAPEAPKDMPRKLPEEKSTKGGRFNSNDGSGSYASAGHKRRRRLMNSAFVFIKPHAVNNRVSTLVKEALTVNEMIIRREGTISEEDVDMGTLIDKHYQSIRSKASLLTPSQLNVSKDAFKSKFGVDWDEALDSGRTLNAQEACAELGLDATQIAAKWSDARKAQRLMKFGEGCYCAELDMEDKGPYYVFNGFFLAMRQRYVAKGAAIQYFVVEWDSKRLSWADFREKVIGPTDPAQAPRSSLRGTLYASWQEWGLHAQPDMGDNGLHASKSPFEGFVERSNWLGQNADRDPFGMRLLQAGISMEQLQDWTKDTQVRLTPDCQESSMFEALIDLDANECLDKCRLIADANPRKAVAATASAALEPAAGTPKEPSPAASDRRISTTTQAAPDVSRPGSATRPEESQSRLSSPSESLTLTELRGIHEAIRELRSENVTLKRQVDSMATEMTVWKKECKVLAGKLEDKA